MTQVEITSPHGVMPAYVGVPTVDPPWPGHSGTAVTEAVYRQQIRPVLEHGATVMNEIFPVDND